MAAKKKPLEVKPAQLGDDSHDRHDHGASARASGWSNPRRRRRRGARARPTSADRGEGTLMANNVLAFAESRGGELRKVAYEAVTAARALADAAGRRSARRASPARPASRAKAEALGTYGADVVIGRRARGVRRLQSRGAGGVRRGPREDRRLSRRRRWSRRRRARTSRRALPGSSASRSRRT